MTRGSERSFRFRDRRLTHKVVRDCELRGERGSCRHWMEVRGSTEKGVFCCDQLSNGGGFARDHLLLRVVKGLRLGFAFPSVRSWVDSQSR
jgi:hypothetical protein